MCYWHSVKEKIVHLRVSQADEKKWKAEAERLGLSLSSYIRLKLNLDVEEKQRLRLDSGKKTKED